MPIYEYQCAGCGQSVDKRHGFDEKMTDACEACGGELKRTFSAAGIVFKGSGFYVTDSRKSSGPNGSSSASSSSSSGSENKTESSSESKSETKSETKAESKTESKKSDAAA